MPYRRFAAEALLEIDPQAARAIVPELIESRRDEEVVFRWSSATALGHLGAVAKDAVPALIKASKDTDGNVREAASAALKRIDPDAAKRAGIE